MSTEIYEYRCSRHKDIGTNLRCGRCDDLICPKCLIQSPVGSRCPDCSKIGQPDILISSKTELLMVSISSFLIIIFGALTLSLITRILWSLPIGYQLGSILTAATLSILGIIVGEIIRKTGKYKIDKRLKIISGFTVFGIFLIGSILGNMMGIHNIVFTNIITFIGVAIGMYIAINRIRP
ncbi:MAG: hypothetical protein CL780_01685 [Chloroflexi bacterium]|nr:hypothetical protein [Chloroflexota bacterium]|tara:strand:- start:1028 stop:1567 length:540 start_codon:yes stop_codon:yes gene_type:complete